MNLRHTDTAALERRAKDLRAEVFAIEQELGRRNEQASRQHQQERDAAVRQMPDPDQRPYRWPFNSTTA